MKYVDAATDLAEAVKRCIQHNDAVIDDDLVVKLNQFHIATNNVSDLLDALKNKHNRYDN